MTVFIFANGELDEVAWIEPHLAQATAIIAADGGTRYVVELGRWPDVIIGDMDSLSQDLEAMLEDGGIEIIRYSHDKNETDLELALVYAVENFPEPIEIYAALGGRLDQTLANISLLAHPLLVGRDVRIVQPREIIWLVTDRTEIVGKIGDTVSLVPLGGDVTIRDTTGLRWPLHNETLKFGRARGISNEMIDERATIAVSAGQLIGVHMTRP